MLRTHILETHTHIDLETKKHQSLTHVHLLKFRYVKFCMIPISYFQIRDSELK